ncbi:MAG: WbqC family protein, partial [Rhodothermaceae bacterium]|nr:WbqC family protein [Rhodothermaceae bacterium]
MSGNIPSEASKNSTAQQLISSSAEMLRAAKPPASLTLLQPACFPDLYYLAAMLRSGRLILQDTEPFSRKGHVHRGLIRTPAGTQWIHVPVRSEDR